MTRKVWHVGTPFSLSIEPTTACNLGCPECPSGLKLFTRPTGKLDLDLHARMLREVGANLFYINYYFQGEPFLHPRFLELIRQAKEHRIYTATSTNAHFITENLAEEIVKSGLDRLIISIDGLTQSTYENYRVHGKLDKVIEGSKYMIAAKKRLGSKTPHLIFQFLAVKQNEHEVPQVFQLGKDMGIDEVRIKTAQLYDYKHGNPLMPDNEKYARYKKQADGTYELKYRTGNHCWRMWSSSVLTWDGKVVPCCFDKDAQHVLGTLEADNFARVWRSPAYNQFRKAVLMARNEIDICQNCSEGAKVWV
ncbi:MAG: radical SAM protein [Bacteroidetes bacterium RIFCSPHIGHO2_02_FULL_44_7]|nr:MAG: radical SAM protein [Bacteroidetes bacterium RIFCSPHIGHO2_02_FULL_44_7]